MDSIQFPAWYQSSSGPQLSQTIVSIAGNVLPVLNFMLQSRGINILPEAINPWISLAVFTFFSIRAAIGYVKSKQVAEAKLKAVASLGNVSIADFNRVTRV